MKKAEVNINKFINSVLKILKAKPRKKDGICLQKTRYIGDFGGEILTITIERGDKLNNQ